jgi:LPXTG-motif cell wall-anchored protein
MTRGVRAVVVSAAVVAGATALASPARADDQAVPVELGAPAVGTECVDGGLLVSVAPVPGVSWTVNGQAADAGPVHVPVGEDEPYGLTVQATALPGFALGPDDTWAIDGVRDCEQAPPPQEPAPADDQPPTQEPSTPTPDPDVAVLGTKIAATAEPAETATVAQLPRTGDQTTSLTVLALVLLAGGVGLRRVGRRTA